MKEEEEGGNAFNYFCDSFLLNKKKKEIVLIQLKDIQKKTGIFYENKFILSFLAHTLSNNEETFSIDPYISFKRNSILS